MKAYEIIPEQVLDEYSDTDKSIIDHLKKQGYKFLGQGVDQTAFLEPSGTVLKIFGTSSDTRIPGKPDERPEFSESHEMFFEWAKYCNKNKNNPFLPKFSGFESFYWKDKVYLQIRQERLKPLSADMADSLEYLADVINMFEPDSVATLFAIVEKYEDPEDMITLRKLEKKLGKSGFDLLVKTISKLQSISKENGYLFDLHGGNFMLNSKGIPVIVDPWVVG